MGRQRAQANKMARRKAYLSASLDSDTELHVQSQIDSTPEKTMATLIEIAEKWMTLTTSKASTVSKSLQSQRSSGRPVMHPPPRRLTAAVTASPVAVDPSHLFSFLDSLPPEEIDDDVLRNMSKEEKEYFLAQNSHSRHEIAVLMREVKKIESCTPMRFRVLRSRLPFEVKKRILSKLEKQNEAMTPGDSVKYNTWVEVLLGIPIGEMLVPQPTTGIAESLGKAKAHLDATIYGHRAAKAAILERFHAWLVTPFALQRPIALCGVPGNGKTSLIREGLAAIMARPFAFITLGGSTDSSSLLGHSYTYEGSMPGRIVEHLCGSRCINPIFYFDELDKCSTTPKGDEIINALIHFTDPVQSDKFRDRYVGAFDIDTSKAMCVFSFNSVTSISNVLLDRLQIVSTDAFDAKEQTAIALKHLLPQILTGRGLATDSMTFNRDEIVRVASACLHGGVRSLRSVLEQAVAKIALWLDAPDPSFLWPLQPRNVEKKDGSTHLASGLDAIHREMQRQDNPPPQGMYC